MNKKENFTLLVTEQNNPDTVNIDTCSTLELVRMINNEDKKVSLAIEKVLSKIAPAIDKATERLSKGGRMLYFGAGTSGRLGVIDASECPPTYGTSPEMVQGIIAGGNGAIFNAAEGDEDNEQGGAGAVKALQVTDQDVVVGIAASGRTPYVLGALKAGNDAGALTVGICNNPDVPMMKIAQITIAPVTGPEAIQGSTRMKAGSAQKMVLNMLSTGVMVKLGKVYRNLMVDVVPNNEKLVDRAKRIVMSATDCDEETASLQLTQCDYNVKLTIVTILTGNDIQKAKRLLEENNGFVSKAIENETR
ncbi:MAG TPA: N-acetylmuramic acid 6-phosphate etherase [Clostridiales bacterium]|nr:N-acetylmuramic acid 6-phosphate etherase [Clostridiales bacterium]